MNSFEIKPAMFSTYILFSDKLNNYYVGQTEDLIQRMVDHNAGRSKFTKSGRPWELVYHVEFQTRSEAIFLEARIKRRGINRYLKETI